MRYPRKDPYLIFKRTGTDQIVVRNYLLEEEYKMNGFTASFLKKLNGRRNPYKIVPGIHKRRVRALLQDFNDCGLLCSEKRFVTTGIGSFLFPLIRCDYLPAVCKKLAKIWNIFLMLACVPMLVLGIIVANSGAFHVSYSGKGEVLVGILLGAVIGLLFHEAGHTCACLAFRGRVFEAGIGMQYFLPIAYVALDYDRVKTRWKRMQILAAGIESNLILYGLFMCLCLLPPGIFSTYELYLAAAGNLGMAILNLLPLDGFDGLGIISAAAGKEDLLEYAKRLVRNKWLRFAYSRKGIKGKISIAASYSLVGFQIGLPILLIWEAISLLRVFIL